jgi:hypothetical protein
MLKLDQKIFFISNGESYDSYAIIGAIVGRIEDKEKIGSLIRDAHYEWKTLDDERESILYGDDAYHMTELEYDKLYKSYPEPYLYDITKKKLLNEGFAWIDVEEDFEVTEND